MPWGFLLNMVWEFTQCTVLYDMWSWGFTRATLWMWGAIFGDVVIVLGVVWLAELAVGEAHLAPLDRRGWMMLLVVGFAWGAPWSGARRRWICGATATICPR